MESETGSVERNFTSWARVLGIGIAVVAALVILSQQLPWLKWLVDFDTYVKGLGHSGLLLYAIVFALAVVLFLPASPLSVGAGALFGFWVGTAVVIVGATSGATLSFLLGRTLLREQVEKNVLRRPSFIALDRAITKSGGRIVFLSRLAPFFPFSLINLAYGVTGIRPLAFVPATALGLIPTTLMFTYLGSTAANVLSTEQDETRVDLQIAGALASVLVMLWLIRFARRAIRDAGIPD